MQEGKNKFWLWVLLAVVVVGGVYLIISSKNNGSEEQSQTEPTENEEIVVLVSDQDASAISVIIDYVKLNTSGFAVIHENENGSPGKILGQSELLSSGEHENVSVIAKLSAGSSYFVVLHRDDGNGQFDPATDPVLKGSDGKNASAMFNAKGEVEGALKG